MGKNKKRQEKAAAAPAREVAFGSPRAVEGHGRVLLLRHGQSEANATGDDVPDALLTDAGRAQATAWRTRIADLGAEVVLVSPLRRAVQTACFAFQDESTPMEFCRPARELYWGEKQNTPGTPAQMQELLRRLPRGDQVRDDDEALVAGPDEPSCEQASVNQLQELLLNRPENRIAVVCHWGPINGLCGASAGNCEILECEWKQSGRLKVVKHHVPQGVKADAGNKPAGELERIQEFADNEPARELEEGKGDAGNEPEGELEAGIKNADDPEEIVFHLGNKLEEEAEEIREHVGDREDNEPEEIDVEESMDLGAFEDFSTKVARNTFPEEVVSRPQTRSETPQGARSRTPQAARRDSPKFADSSQRPMSEGFETTEDDWRTFGARTLSPDHAGPSLKRGLTEVFSRSLPSLPMESQGVLKRPPHLKNLSHVRSLPKFRFGEKRPSAFFRYNSNPAPGSYNLPEPGRTGKFREKPVCSFGGGPPRFGYAPNPHHVQPAPGQYGIVKNPVLPSTGNDRKVAFSMAPRKLPCTVRAEGPGPGAYESKSTLGSRGAKSAGKLPKFFRPEDALPGPGQYSPTPPVHCSLSHEVSARMVGFGTSTRTNYADKFCRRTPPPGAYDHQTYGELGMSRNGKFAFRGRQPAPSSFTSYITPGPGTYDSDGTCFGY